jgi:hypothetical protein
MRSPLDVRHCGRPRAHGSREPVATRQPRHCGRLRDGASRQLHSPDNIRHRGRLRAWTPQQLRLLANLPPARAPPGLQFAGRVLTLLTRHLEPLQTCRLRKLQPPPTWRPRVCSSRLLPFTSQHPAIAGAPGFNRTTELPPPFTPS